MITLKTDSGKQWSEKWSAYYHTNTVWLRFSDIIDARNQFRQVDLIQPLVSDTVIYLVSIIELVLYYTALDRRIGLDYSSCCAFRRVGDTFTLVRGLDVCPGSPITISEIFHPYSIFFNPIHTNPVHHIPIVPNQSSPVQSIQFLPISIMSIIPIQSIPIIPIPVISIQSNPFQSHGSHSKYFDSSSPILSIAVQSNPITVKIRAQ